MDNLSNNRNKKVTETHVVGALSLFKWFNWAHVVGSMYLFNWFNWDTCGGIYVFIQLIQQLSGVDWHMYRYCTIWWFSPHSCLQYCGSMTFWGGSGSGSGSADPCSNGSGSGCGTGSCYFRHWPSQDANKKQIFKQFFCLLLFEGPCTSFSKIISQKEVTKQ